MKQPIQTQEFMLSETRYRALLTTKMPRRAIITVVILSVLSVVLGALRRDFGLMLTLLAFPALLMLIPWGTPYILALVNPYRQHISPGSVTFEADHVTYTRHDGEQMQIPWMRFHRISIRDKAFVFWLNQSVFFIVPFDVFQHAEEIDIIKDTIAHNTRTA